MGLPKFDDESLFALSDIKKLKNTSGLYFLFNKNDEVIYIGKAVHIYNRVNAHRVGSGTYVTSNHRDEIYNVKVLYLDNTMKDISIKEMEMIKKFRPSLNRAGLEVIKKPKPKETFSLDSDLLAKLDDLSKTTMIFKSKLVAIALRGLFDKYDKEGKIH